MRSPKDNDWIVQAVAIFSRIDGLLFLTIFVLAGIGLVVQYSTSGQNIDQLWQQVFRVLIAVGLMIALANIPLTVLEKYTPHLYLLGITLLLLVAMIGFGRGGAQRWLNLGGISLQPSELLKLTVPMMVAWVLMRFTRIHRNLNFAICGLIILIPAYLIYEQPDLGTALLLIAVGAYAVFLGGLSWRLISTGAMLSLASIPLIWPLLHEYQRLRVTTVFNPWQDPTGDGYHSIQSMIAIGSGGTGGKGWLNGSQSQLEFIPERSTDFVFSVFAEEFGLIGVFVLLLVFAVLISRCLFIAYQAKNSYTRIVVGSIAIMVFTHVFVNIGMVSGMLPVVGLPLPIISFGGTSMVTVLAGIGIVMGARHEI